MNPAMRSAARPGPDFFRVEPFGEPAIHSQSKDEQHSRLSGRSSFLARADARDPPASPQPRAGRGDLFALSPLASRRVRSAGDERRRRLSGRSSLLGGATDPPMQHRR